MTNSLTKKLSCILLALVCSLTCVFIPSADISAKVKKPARVSISSVVRVNKTTLKINWKKASRAKGYEVYMKTNSGGFKKIKTTTSRSLKKSGLKVGNAYCFKVRAYTKSKGKKYYGAFSMVKKIKLNSWVYLTDVMDAYRTCSDGYWGCNYGEFSCYKGSKYFIMCSNKYYHGITQYIHCNDKSAQYHAYYNLNGKYKKMTFTLGAVDGNDDYDQDFYIVGDDDNIKEINRKAHTLPKNYSVSISSVYKLEFVFSGRESESKIGVANIKLYY